MFPRFIKIEVTENVIPITGKEVYMIEIRAKRFHHEEYGKMWIYATLYKTEDKAKDLAEIENLKQCFIRAYDILEKAYKRPQEFKLIIEDQPEADYYPPCMV